VRAFTLGGTRRGQQGRTLARRHGDRELVVVTAAEHVRPEARPGADDRAGGRRQRHEIALDMDHSPDASAMCPSRRAGRRRCPRRARNTDQAMPSAVRGCGSR
jgi:hypothetical protein